MWEPQSEDDLLLAIAEGTLTESASLDVKAETGSTDSSRRETAKDLASFAIDGGALLIGIAEDKNARAFSLAPIPLKDVVEKLEQIAANRIDPPLHVRVREIPTDDDAERGYIFVEIPPSAHAPHMVSGIYYARGERTARRLTDAEVVRLHGLRQRQDQRIRDLLEAEIERDPVPTDRRSRGHLYLVAEPLSAPIGLARDIARGRNNTAMFELRQSSEPHITRDIRDFAPEPSSAGHWSRRARGGAFTTLNGGGRSLGREQKEELLVDLELEEDGGIRVVVGRMTGKWGQDSDDLVILDGLAVAYCLRLAYWARELSLRTGYRGAWAFGVAATGLSGLSSAVYRQNWSIGSPTSYDRGRYISATSAHCSELDNTPSAIAERLIGGLLRGLGTDGHYRNHFPEQVTAEV